MVKEPCVTSGFNTPRCSVGLQVIILKLPSNFLIDKLRAQIKILFLRPLFYLPFNTYAIILTEFWLKQLWYSTDNYSMILNTYGLFIFLISWPTLPQLYYIRLQCQKPTCDQGTKFIQSSLGQWCSEHQINNFGLIFVKTFSACSLLSI